MNGKSDSRILSCFAKNGMASMMRNDETRLEDDVIGVPSKVY